jgi:hypothetical protein
MEQSDIRGPPHFAAAQCGLQSASTPTITKEMSMRLLLALAIVLAAVALDARRQAAAQWCAYYDAYTYTCGFVSFNQCLATISGVGGVCRRDHNYREPRRDDRRSLAPSGRGESRGNGY